MPRFAANLSLLYTELPFLDRFAAAARDGFEAVEFLFPYAWPAHEIAARLRDHGLQQVLFNAPPGGTDPDGIEAAWRAGQRGTASLPGREAEFRAGVHLALDCAQALQCPRLHLMAGLRDPRHSADAHHATYVENLHWAAEQAQARGVRVLIEPINTRDMPGYVLNHQAHAHAIVAAVGSPHLQVQMDLYHCQIMEGDVAHQIAQYLPSGRVGHLQIAGVPERHEPDVGELRYEYLFDLIDTVSAQCGWQGWLGCEYRPRRGTQPGATSDGLGWLRAARAAAAPAQACGAAP